MCGCACLCACVCACLTIALPISILSSTPASIRIPWLARPPIDGPLAGADGARCLRVHDQRRRREEEAGDGDDECAQRHQSHGSEARCTHVAGAQRAITRHRVPHSDCAWDARPATAESNAQRTNGTAEGRTDARMDAHGIWESLRWQLARGRCHRQKPQTDEPTATDSGTKSSAAQRSAATTSAIADCPSIAWPPSLCACESAMMQRAIQTSGSRTRASASRRMGWNGTEWPRSGRSATAWTTVPHACMPVDTKQQQCSAAHTNGDNAMQRNATVTVASVPRLFPFVVRRPKRHAIVRERFGRCGVRYNIDRTNVGTSIIGMKLQRNMYNVCKIDCSGDN